MEKDYRSLEQKIRNIIIESNNFRNTNARLKVVNVARPDDADPTSEKSKLAKQSEIKTKIIDEEKDEDKNKKPESEKDDDDKKKSKAGASKAEDEFTGDKTEVDTEPKTDDKVNDESSEKKKGDKETKKVNKEIGAKGAGAVKEESSMFGTKKNFGLPDSLIAAVTEAMKIKKEELKGDQHKIDKNKNGKIDAHDFKLLKKEEVELDELSKDTLYSYGHKADKQILRTNVMGVAKRTGGVGMKNAALKLKNRKAGSELAFKKAQDMNKLTKEEVEELDELKKSTLGSYINKAAKDIGRSREQRIDKDRSYADRDKAFDREYKRKRGINQAVNKLTKEEVQFSKEEIARIEEIAKGL